MAPAKAAVSASGGEDVKRVAPCRPLGGAILTGGDLEKPIQLSEDVELLNRTLRSGVRFEIRRPPSGLTSCQGDGYCFLIGALHTELKVGCSASAVSLFVTAETNRERRLVLAMCLADCAMALGLGTGIF